MNLTLQEILIVGSSSEQVKFSELTMDMFRMIQTLEREPQEDFNHIYDASPAPGRVPYSVPGQKGLVQELNHYHTFKIHENWLEGLNFALEVSFQGLQSSFKFPVLKIVFKSVKIDLKA